MKLRQWQSRCIDQAVMQLSPQSPHFFCQATPAAGKTRMAAGLALALLKASRIDLVICFAPSRQIVAGIQSTFADVLGRRLDGAIGAVGATYTYQAMPFLDASFWQLLDEYRVLAVFDEIHHCAGGDPVMSNRWGQEIIQRVQDRAAYTLALSGTPWRSDERCIALARYSNPQGTLVCDYRYGLEAAVRDGACRSPRIVLLDNQQVRLELQERQTRETREFGSVGCLLRESPVTYEDLLHHEDIMGQLLNLAMKKLAEVRSHVADAGGLVVATDVEHAHLIASYLARMGEDSMIVTYRSPDAQKRIEIFRHGKTKWIISVGMISEGTDIPRLQVCCYLSRIRTEMYFRQVLGRILRRRKNNDNHAWLYALAEPMIKCFAKRIADDLPSELAVLSKLKEEKGKPEENTCQASHEASHQLRDTSRLEGERHEEEGETTPSPSVKWMEVYFSQQYRQQLLAIY